MESNLRVTFNDLEISPGKRVRYSDSKLVKRSKHTKQNIEETNFIKASIKVSQIAQLDTLKRLKLLKFPKCSICMNTSTKLDRSAMPSIVVTMFENELRLNTWYDALETCFYWITPTQYLPENVLRGIVEIILNAHNDITTPYSIHHIINRCREILAYHFNMHPPCKAHTNINKCYTDFLNKPMDDKTQTYSKRKNFGHSNGIIKYCFNRLEDELYNNRKDNPIYSKDDKDNIYTSKYRDRGKETLHRLNWEQQTFEIYEMLKRNDRIDRLMAVLHSVVELIQLDIYFYVGAAVRQSFLQTLCGKNNDLRTQIMKLFVHLIHFHYPEEHIKVLSLWINAFVQMIYFHSNSTYSFSSPHITNFENNFYEIISELPHQSVIKILGKIEPPCIKYLICRRYTHKILSVHDHSIINIIINFIHSSQWREFVKSNEDFIPSTTNKDIQQTDLLNQLSYICNNVSHKSKKFKSGKITQNEVIQVLYISLEALFEAYYVKQIYNISKQDNVEDVTLQVTANIELEKHYSEIYELLQTLTGLLQSNELPKCMECFKIIIN